ncbi:MAG: thioesterase family protein [Candidatus Poseidoniia archaeon]|nr:thioesterase family protein [Candidatus Poseidoniia archaeon]
MALGSWPVSVELPVQWAEMDHFGHVNNTVFLRWFESARIAYFQHLWSEGPSSEAVGPILARMEIDYRLPLQYPDTVRCEATVTNLGNSSFRMAYRLFSEARGDVIAAEGDSVVVMVDYRSGKSVPLTQKLRTAIEAVEADG